MFVLHLHQQKVDTNDRQHRKYFLQFLYFMSWMKHVQQKCNFNLIVVLKKQLVRVSFSKGFSGRVKRYNAYIKTIPIQKRMLYRALSILYIICVIKFFNQNVILSICLEILTKKASILTPQSHLCIIFTHETFQQVQNDLLKTTLLTIQ